MFTVSALLILCLGNTVIAELRLSLDSSELDGTWTVENGNKSIRTNGRVPGGVYSDLADSGVFNQSIFYRQNDHEYRWVSRDNWTYSRNFDVPLEFLQKEKINIVLHGVDTVAEVLLNGQSLGTVDNMFVRSVFTVRPLIREKNNTLEVRITSAVTAAAARAAALPLPVLPNCVPSAYQGECHANKLRKMQASFSWDWGPAFPGAGIWKSVEIEAFDIGVIRDVTVFTQKLLVDEIPCWGLNVTVYADLGTETYDGPVIGILRLEDGSKKVLTPRKTSHRSTTGNYSYVGELEFVFDETDVAVWWPNSYGDQPLYQFNVSFILVTDSEQVTKSIRLGFRTVELVQENVLPAITGLSFYFKVNGVQMFMKGSNWIPGHVLPELGDDEDIVVPTLQSAKEAHMNMLRVWGGGVYESDLFYQTADEMGILIWQDFMFACAMYPATPAFLQSVATEVEQQVRRIQHHPSVAVWAGNNENEAALRGDWYGTNNEFNRYKAEYKSLYVNTIRPIVEENDPSRSYVVSSPSNGLNSELQDYIATDPYSAVFGDVHYYNYLADGWKSTSFPDTRFASEYGYQGMPSFLSIKEVSIASDWSIKSEFSQLRQHHPEGYTEIQLAIAYQLPLPDDDGTEEYFSKFIYMSQISQGMSTKTESEKYRRDRSKVLSDGKGVTMGALYWQLNDVWQAPTWSSIELSGRWKLLHYLAKKFFAPILVSSQMTSVGELNVYAVSDLLEDVEDVNLDVHVMSYDSFTPKLIFSSNHTIVQSSSKLIFQSSVNDLLTAAGCAGTRCFFHYRLSKNGTLISENMEYNGSLQQSFNTSANVTVTLTDSGATNATLTISADAVAPFVWLETTASGVFSDNGFTMTSGSVDVIFDSRGKPFDLQEFTDSLTVRDLTDVMPKKAVSGFEDIDLPYVVLV